MNDASAVRCGSAAAAREMLADGSGPRTLLTDARIVANALAPTAANARGS